MEAMDSLDEFVVVDIGYFDGLIINAVTRLNSINIGRIMGASNSKRKEVDSFNWLVTMVERGSPIGVKAAPTPIAKQLIITNRI